MGFVNCYDDVKRAESYARLGFANTYYLACRDISAIIREHVTGTRSSERGPQGTGEPAQLLTAPRPQSPRQCCFVITGASSPARCWTCGHITTR